MRHALLLLVGLCASAACADPKTPESPSEATKAPLVAAAVVNNEVILRCDLDARIGRLAQKWTLTERTRRRLLRKLLDEQIEAMLVDSALREAGIQVSVEETDLRLAVRREELGGVEALARYLDETGLTEVEFRAELRRELGLDRLIADQMPHSIDEDAVERIHHLEHGDETTKREARFSMILLRLPLDAGPADDDRVRRDLRRVLRRIEGSLTFEEAALEFSQDPTREVEGQWEYTELDRLEPLLRAAVETAEVGEITDPIRTADGWILLRVDGRRSEMDTEADARKAVLRSRLLAAHGTEMRDKFLKRLREEATVEVSEDLR